MPGGLDALFRLNITQVVNGQQCINSFFARSKPTDPLPSLAAVCDQLITDYELWIQPGMRGVQTGSVQHTQAQALCLNPPLVAQSIKSYTTVFGLVAGDTLPPHDAAVLSWYTVAPGRRTHGRTYLAGFPENRQNLGIIDAVGKADIKNLADTMLGRFGEGGTSPYYWFGVYSRKNGVTRDPGPPPMLHWSVLTHVPWKRFTVNEVLGTQRHRRIGRGI